MDNNTEKTNDGHLQHSLPISVISAIPYTLNEDSLPSSDDDGPDVYVPPYAIPSMSISNIGKSFSIESEGEQIDHSDPSEGHHEDQGHQENIEDGVEEEVIDDISIDGCNEERNNVEHKADGINRESQVSICGLSQDKETETKLDNFRFESDKEGSGNIIQQTEIDGHMAEETEIKGKNQNREVKQMEISKEKENSEWKKMDDDECSSTFTTKLRLDGTCHVKSEMCESNVSEVTKAMSEDTTQEDKLVDKSNASQVSGEGDVQLQTNMHNESKESESNTHDSVKESNKSLIVDNRFNLESAEKQNVKAVNRVQDKTVQNKIKSKEHPSVPIKPVNAVNYNPGRVGQLGQFQFMPPNYPYYNVGALHQPGLPQPYHPYPLSPPYTGFHVSPMQLPPQTGNHQPDSNGRRGDNLIADLSSETSKLPVSPTNKKVGENEQFESEINPAKASQSETTNHDKPYPGLLPDKELADNKMVPDNASTKGSKIVTTFTGDISEYTLRYYFENTRKSGGGEIEDMDFSPDTGVAVVEFKDNESAANVLKKQNVHKVSDVELKIHVIEQEADMSRWLEEEKVFVTGVMNTTTEDCLNDYIEVKSGAEPTNISYGRDKTSALITFEDKVDFTKLRTGCLMKALEGSTLTVSRVPVTRTVLVSGIGHDSGITNDTVKYYFENERRSSGHEDAEILEYDSDTCVIRFPSPAVARRVCDKTQKIGERTLEVCLFYEFLGKPGKALEIPEPEIISADFNILKFIKNLPSMKEDFEKKLLGLYGHIEWPEDVENDEVKIVCDLDLSTSEGQKAVESWQTDINNCTEEFISTLTTMRITTLPEAWGEVVKGLRTLIIADPEKACVILEKENNDILMVGERNIIKNLYLDIQKIVSRSEGRSSHTETTPTKVLSFKVYKLQLLWLLKYFDVVSQKYPGLQAKCNLDAREVTLAGNVESMQAAELFLRETTNSFVVKTFKMSKQKKDLLFKKGAREVWYQEAKTKQIIATWNIDRGHVCEMYANSKKEAERAIICIEDLFLEDEFVVDENYEDFIQSSQWTELQGRLAKRDENCFCVRTDRGRIQLAATKYIFQEIKLDIQKEIDDFSKLHCRHTKTINCDKGIHLYIRHNHQKEIQKIEKTLKSMDVKITSDNQNYSYEIKGNKTGITLASSKLDALMKTIHSDKHKLHSYGIRDYFLSPPGKKETIDIGKKHSSVVLQEKDYSEEKARRAEKGGELRLSAPGVKRVFIHDEVHKIYLVEGDITQLDIDAIVNAANNDMDHCGGLAKAIADAAGKTVQDECHEYVKKHGQVRDGDAIYSKPGKLPCKMIIHAVGPVWKGGKQGERNLLKAAVLQCLALTEQRSYKTVAIPALSGGIFGYPLDDCTITIVETIKEYFDQNGSTTTVTGVYLCDISGETIKLFQDALQDAYSNEKRTEKGKHRYPDVQRPLKYPGHDSESDLQPIRYPDTQPNDASSNPIRYPHSGEATSDYPSDWSNYHTASRDTSSGSEDDFIKVVKGLLTQRKVDMIVNSVSHSLDLSRGRLSKSILGAAGDIIQTEIYQYIGTFQPFHNVAVTSGGNMPCKNIVHGVLAPFDGLETKSVKILQMFILMCLNSASDHKMTSIAFPAIGTGVLNFPVDIVAKTMFEIVLLYKQKVPDSSIKSVEFVIYPEDTAAVRAFEDEQRKVRRKTSSQTITENSSKHYINAQVSVDEDRPVPSKGSTTKLGNIDVLIKCGDITKEKSDAIVNTTSHSYDLSKGAVSKAILAAAGSDIQKELVQEAERSSSKGLVVTSGGKMNCKYIFHIIAQSTLSGWEAAVNKCLTAAENRKLSTMALPALGTGIKACKPEDVASAIFSAIKKFSTQHIKQVTLVVFQKEMAADFITELKKTDGLGGKRDHTDTRDYSDRDNRGYGHRGSKGRNTDHRGAYRDTTARDSEHRGGHRDTSGRNTDHRGVLRGGHRGGHRGTTPRDNEHRGFKDGHDDKDRQPYGDASKKESKPDTIKFYIWSDSWDSIKAVKKDLDKVADAQCYDKSIHEYSKVVHNLKDEKIFRDIEKQLKVKITENKGVINILGSQAQVNKAGDALQAQLRKEEARMIDYDKAKEVANYIQWYYKDPSTDKFKPFTLELNYVIETEFKNKSPQVRITDNKGERYKIDLNKMEEIPASSPHTKIPVQRKSKEQQKGPGVNLPANWTHVKLDGGQLCHEQQLHPGIPEYDRVKSEFQKTGGSGTIVKIFRVQNPTLYLQYAAKKKELYNKNGKNPERWLWHGTSADTVDKIITLGFNRSYCGKNGTAYGAGVYFAVNSSYSIGYCTSDTHGMKHMFSTQVLTGDACSGSGGMTVLPSKPGKSLTYDSASDNPSNPVMFIIFHDSQAYPTYHVFFK
ncbi:protein mono-ADP-ribosyltransferase PARP14-like isoform X3 [Mytilus edulis]|uniref:protein mono-ADP-ribosyltransferase PARP14-like isoform X3 n=1 Tax=Mytilus edulis TaxID=6550 RepID=UPI0039EED038